MTLINGRPLEEYALFKRFWKTPEPAAGEEDDGMSHFGLQAIGEKGANNLFEYAKMHSPVEGTVSSTPMVDDVEKQVIKALMTDAKYAPYWGQDGRAVAMELFGIKPADVAAQNGAPVDQGELAVAPRVSKYSATQLAGYSKSQLPKLFATECQTRNAFFETVDVTESEKGARVLALLRDYTAALWSSGHRPDVDTIGKDLLATFFKQPFARVHGAKDYNGAGWGAAQGLVLMNIDPNVFLTKFNDAFPCKEYTSLSMNGAMAGPMKSADRYLEATGKQAAGANVAEKFEKAPVLNYLVGLESGHTKHGSLSEADPFGTSGVNFGIALFPNDADVAAAKKKSNFNFPIDCIDGFGNMLGCDPKRGERLVVCDSAGVELKAEKVVEEVSGEKVWSAKFFRANGDEVPASEVIGRIRAKGGLLKGDGKVNGSVNMWWWGFCDRYTAMQLYKAKFHIPQVAREQVPVKAGSEVVWVPKKDAQELIDTHTPDISTNTTFLGFRFDDEPQQIVLKNGTTITGRLKESVLDDKPEVLRLGGDTVSIINGDSRPLLGKIEVQTLGANGVTRVEEIAVKEIKSFTKDPATGAITVERKYSNSVGTIVDEKKFLNWSNAQEVDGKLVIKQDESFPVRGALWINTATEAKKIPLSEIQSITAETQHDVRFSQIVAWYSKNEGLTARDSALNTVVSNGTGYVQDIQMEEHTDAGRPEWAGGADAPVGFDGPLTRQEGDKVVWMRGLYAWNKDAEPTSTAFSGWVQIDKDGVIINDGFNGSAGQVDFFWSVEGKPNWMNKSTFNPHLPSEFVVSLLLNGCGLEGDELAAFATKMNFPSNWQDLVVPAGTTPPVA